MDQGLWTALAVIAGAALILVVGFTVLFLVATVVVSGRASEEEALTGIAPGLTGAARPDAAPPADLPSERAGPPTATQGSLRLRAGGSAIDPGHDVATRLARPPALAPAGQPPPATANQRSGRPPGDR
jgi:hypothetical protein